MLNSVPTTDRKTILWGIHNAAAFNLQAEGDRSYFPTEERRDAALAELRTFAIDRGLSRSSARSGITPFRVYRPEDAASLDELCETLNWIAEAGREIDPTSLPVFGGEEPESTIGIYSWDETRLLVPGSGREAWKLIARPTNTDDEE